MTRLEEMKIKAELSRVEAAKAEQEFNIAQREDEIERLQKSLIIQEERIKELRILLNTDKRAI